MLTRLRDLVRRRPISGVGVSLLLHVLLGVLVLGGGPWPSSPPAVKRGEPLFIELPATPEPAPAGNPAVRSPGAPGPVARSRPAPRASRPAAPVPPPRPAPPAMASRSQPAPEPAPAPRPEPVPPPAPTPALPEARPTPPPEAPPSSEPSPVVAAAPPAPTPPVAPSPASPFVSTPAPSAPPASEAAPAGRAPVSPGGGQVASLPPGRERAAPPIDIKSALRRGGGGGGGAGGAVGGRGGIEGEPVPLDSPDPKYSDYLDRIRRMIKERWGYPCVKNGTTRECEYKTAQLVVEFGIAKDGQVPFVEVRRSSGWPIYDDYAVNAIKLAAPFPPVPDAISRKGIPILATFNYVVDTSLTNLLR